MDGKKTLVQDLTTGSVPRQLLTFAAPLFLSGLLQTVYNTVDTIVVGQCVGSYGLSAVSIGGEILHILTFIAMGISNAGQVIISQFIGAGKHDSVKKLIGTLFTFLLSAAVVMTVLCLVLHNDILTWINTPKEAFAYAKDYVLTCTIGLVFIYGYNLVSAILRGMGDSKHPFMFIAVAAVLNLVLDLLFTAVFGWGTFGAALATVLGQAVSFIWSLIFLYKRKEQFGFDFKLQSFKIDGEVFKPLIKLGIPMMLQSAAISFSKLFVDSYVNAYGVIASAVTGIGSKLSMITGVFAQAFSTAGATMIAQAIGAEKYKRVPKIIGVSLLIDGIVAVILSLATVFFPRLVFGMFTSDEAVLEMAMLYIPVALVLYAGCVLRPPMFSLINGSGNSKLNLCVALLDGVVVRIGLALYLGLVAGWGIHGFWYGHAFAGTVPFFIGGVYYLSGKWKTRKHIIGEK
ncbi:MAG: MATE family efflux transporter [Clostridiales bacterium]|nr:MATE family efflux transporter [Clostridiales bacterium]